MAHIQHIFASWEGTTKRGSYSVYIFFIYTNVFRPTKANVEIYNLNAGVTTSNRQLSAIVV